MKVSIAIILLVNLIIGISLVAADAANAQLDSLSEFQTMGNGKLKIL